MGVYYTLGSQNLYIMGKMYLWSRSEQRRRASRAVVASGIKRNIKANFQFLKKV